MASKTALPIARLRALGCRVSTVIGHDPAIGDWIYSVRVPDSAGDLRELGDDGTVITPQGAATATVPRHSDGHHVIVRTALYRIGAPRPTKSEHDAAERDIAGLLSALADVLNGR